ncbi:MAG: hypothetical protein CMH16_01730 [Methylobacterium sp.]|jgi:hypothetical protein|nr:hypothetical protein [Methylobacterium sp.]
MGPPLAATLPELTPGSGRNSAASATERPAKRQTGLTAVTARLWAEHVARIRTIEARTSRIMGGG